MLSKFSVKKPYTVVVGIVLIIILGIVSFRDMTVDLLPSMNLPYAIVMTTYPGASPEEVEEIVTKPVEQTMATVSNIKNIQSVSSENASTVMLEFEQTANMDSVTIEMRENLDQISGFWPEEIASPMIMKLNPDMLPVLVTAVSAKGKDAVEASRIIEDKVIPEVESVEGVASVMATGNITETVEVTLNKEKIDGLSDDIQEEMQAQLDEAKRALDEAKSQVESGKNALASGKNQASSGIGQAEAQISVKSEELKQAQLEITEKMAQLNVSETQLNQSFAVVKAGREAAEAQLEQLEDTKESYDQAVAQWKALKEKEENGETLSPEEQALKTQLETMIKQLKPVMDTYGATKEELTAALEKLIAQEESLKDSKEQMAAGKKQLEDMQTQVNNGAMTLAEARGQLASAQLETAVGLGEGAAQLAAGQTALAVQEAQMEAASKEAGASLDTDSILSAATIEAMLGAQNFRMPAGYVNEESIDYLVRIGDKFESVDEMKNLILLDMEGIDPIKLSDVADVEVVNNADETYAKINGKPGVMLSIQKQTGYSTGDVSHRVQDKLEELNKEYKDLKVVNLMDQGMYIDMIVDSVLDNLIYGAILAILILLVFLKSIRPTFVIACSIPISIMAAIVAMYFSGVTLNIISLSGLALGVGMLVDNSIVVIENIYRMRNEEGASAKKAAIEGARQVSGAILASTLTTVCVFLPIVFTKGITRQLFVDMGLTIAYSLLASLLTALTIVPMMSAGVLRETKEKETNFFGKIRSIYGNILEKALDHKGLVLAGALILFVGSIVLAMSRGTEFMPAMESTQISMTLETEKGTSLEDTAKEDDKVMDEVGRIKDIEDVGALVSTSDLMGTQTVTNQVSFYAITNDNPELSNKELQKEIEKRTKDVDGELTIYMSNMDMSALGSSGVNVQIQGKDLDKLQEISSDIKKLVADTKGTQNVSDGNGEELRVSVDKEKAAKYGLTVAQVYQELYGKLAEPKQAMTLGTDTYDYDVYVVDDARETLSRADIKDMVISAKQQDGTTKEVKLSETAELKEGYNIGLVSNEIRKKLDEYKVPEGYEIKMAGEDETINDAMTELFKMLGLALVFMYLIMVAQFQSLRSPFIIMFTVPLAFTGGLLALWMAGMSVSVIAMIGFVMLSGIIVNNGIVFIDYTNQLMAGGMPKKEALVTAGKTRLRPIIMTALTTILGLFTLAMGVGMGADMVQPMAVVTIGGLIYGTILTLVVVPCIFALFHRREKARLVEGMEDN